MSLFSSMRKKTTFFVSNAKGVPAKHVKRGKGKFIPRKCKKWLVVPEGTHLQWVAGFFPGKKEGCWENLTPNIKLCLIFKELSFSHA